VSLPQVLHLAVGNTVAGKISNSEWLKALLRDEPDDDKALDAVFLRTLARKPTAAERAAVKGLVATADRGDVFRDLLWAVLNSKEFLFNR
jgi:hypothetical protein